MRGEEVLMPMVQLGWGREEEGDRKLYLYGKYSGDSELDVLSFVVCCIPMLV